MVCPAVILCWRFLWHTRQNTRSRFGQDSWESVVIKACSAQMIVAGFTQPSKSTHFPSPSVSGHLSKVQRWSSELQGCHGAGTLLITAVGLELPLLTVGTGCLQLYTVTLTAILLLLATLHATQPLAQPQDYLQHTAAQAGRTAGDHLKPRRRLGRQLRRQ
jgi:hypothetical protein